jgi:hypothetical protein
MPPEETPKLSKEDAAWFEKRIQENINKKHLTPEKAKAEALLALKARQWDQERAGDL